MSVAQRLDPFVHGTSLALVAYLPYRPVIALSRRLATAINTPRPGAVAVRRHERVTALLGDWDPEGAVADLQRPCLGR
jgi:hypothetical protein